MNQRLVIVGAGGHAKVVAEAAKLSGFEIVGFIEHSPDRWGTKILGIPVLGDESVFDSPDHNDCVTVVAVGDNMLRESIVTRLTAGNVKFAKVVHPSAVISPSATLGDGTVILAGVVINSMATVGDHCIVNTMASLDHDCSVEDFAHLSPGVHLAGNCEIGRLAHIGIGASILPNIFVGPQAVIGGGAAVTCDIPADAVAVGVPAKVVK